LRLLQCTVTKSIRYPTFQINIAKIKIRDAPDTDLARYPAGRISANPKDG
jgi:hypothetical protein